MKTIIIIFLLFFSFYAFADEGYLIELKGVETRAERQKPSGTEITREDLEKTGVQDLNQALSRLPGVDLSEGGARGESSFSVRGFDSSYIPVIVDGISVTSPFNGRGDSGGLLTGDLESVLVQKGYSSMLTGVNGIGGAVVLSLSKPKKVFEGSLKTTAEFDSIFSLASKSYLASVGSKLKKVYFKATVQNRDVDHWRVPDSYRPIKGSVQEKGKRLFSDRSDFKTTLMAGTTPFEGLDVWGVYVSQDSDRGMNPPEVNPVYSLWGWDYWKRRSTSLHGEYKGGGWDVRFLAFYDKYDNSLSSYSSFLHMDYKRPYRISRYDEYAAGMRINISKDIALRHTLRGAFSFRQDDHWGYREDLVRKDDIHVKENKTSSGLEYEYKLLKNLRFVASAGFDSLQPVSYWSRDGAFAEYMGIASYIVKTQDRWLLAAQTGIFYEIFRNNELRLTYARRNQFPTMSDRYATSFANSMPNPNLKPEMADHFEFGYKGTLSEMLLIDTSVYYSYVMDKMAVIKVVDPFNTRGSVDFMTNLDAVSFYGFELSSSLFLGEYLETGVNLSLSDYKINKSLTKAKTVTYYPKFTVNGYIELKPWDDYISIMPVVEYRDKRYTDIYEVNYLEPYFLIHLYASLKVCDYFKIDLSVRNITDELYELRTSYPLAGRTYSISATIKY